MYIYTHTHTYLINLGEGNGNPLQYSCLENPMDRGAWRAIVHGVASQTRLDSTTILNLKSGYIIDTTFMHVSNIKTCEYYTLER